MCAITQSTTRVHTRSILKLAFSRFRAITGSFVGPPGTTHLISAMAPKLLLAVTRAKRGPSGSKTKFPRVSDNVAEAMKTNGATASAIFVPPPFAPRADSSWKGVDAGSSNLVFCITGGIPVNEQWSGQASANGGKKVQPHRPNCPRGHTG